MDKTLKDYVNFFNNDAFLFKNGYTNTWQYFIPMIEYDSIVKDTNFNQDTPTVLIANGEIVCSIKSLMGKDFLTGDKNIFIVPIQYDKRPLLNKFTKDSSEDDLFEKEIIKEPIKEDEEEELLNEDHLNSEKV